MCVCVFGIHVLKIAIERWFWEVNLVFGSLIEFHDWLHSCLCFSPLEKLFLKASSTPPRHLLDTWLSVELPNFFLSQSRHLLDTWWIDRESSYPFDSFLTPSGSIKPHLLCLMFLYLDTFSTPISVDGQILNTWLNTLLDTFRHLYLLSFTKVLYILPHAIWTSFLSKALFLHLPNTLISLPIFSLRFLQAFWRVSSLGMLLISHCSCISCFET